MERGRLRGMRKVERERGIKGTIEWTGKRKVRGREGRASMEGW